MKINTFEKNSKIEWVACDTETHTYIDNKLVSTEDLKAIARDPLHDQNWFRQNTRSVAYAWLFSDGVHFAWLESFEEYCEFICEHKIKACWWYNCKFDFSYIDYAILSGENGAPIWSLYEGDKGVKNQYDSLHNNMGARYSLKLWYEYKGRGRGVDRHARVHSFTNYDFCNIFGGGLRDVLEKLNVVDYEGNKIRKLTMDYQAEEITEEAIKYMEVDVKGLYHAIRIANEFLKNTFGYEIAGAKPSFMTAGGLAKKILLKYLFGYEQDYKNVKAFQRLYEMNSDIDIYVREHYLYRGGICLVNKRYQNINIFRNFFRYDINSMYPAQMSEMPALVGVPDVFTFQQWEKLSAKDKENYEVIYEIDEMLAYQYKNMLPIWFNHVTKRYDDVYNFGFSDKSMCIFEREFIEMQEWYEIIHVHINRVIAVQKTNLEGYKNFVNDMYEMKAQAKRERNKVKLMFSKLLLNSSYGKLAERVERWKTHRELNPLTGTIHLVYDEIECDDDKILSVIQGALVTSMARIRLCKLIRTCCDNPSTQFLYCDTDSIHCFTEYMYADDFKLGELKLEAECVAGKFLAPKTYIEIDDKFNYEPHSKGIPLKSVIDRITYYDLKEQRRKYYDVDEAFKIFSVGEKFEALAGMNVKGGKALIPIEKFLCTESNTIMRNDNGAQELFIKDE